MTNPALSSIPIASYEEQLAEQLIAAQANLKVSKQILADAEAAIAQHFGVKEEGSQSIHVADRYKVTTTGKINRTIAAPIWDEVKQEIPEPLADRLVQYKPSLNLRELRYVEENEPEWFAKIAKAITSKPGKASIKVEVVEAQS